MRDIVSTIQAEQDAVIRLPLAGIVVIEGGPGTGKTAVALHRVAYLLYTHRERLARRGVLVVGPSGPFLDYVGGVLPSLGESAVVFTTPGRLHHGVDATAVDDAEVARMKGDLAMCAVLRKAVAAEQTLPDEPIPIALDAVDGGGRPGGRRRRPGRPRATAGARTTRRGWCSRESARSPSSSSAASTDHRRGAGRPGRRTSTEMLEGDEYAATRRSPPPPSPATWPTTCATSWSTTPASARRSTAVAAAHPGAGARRPAQLAAPAAARSPPSCAATDARTWTCRAAPGRGRRVDGVGRAAARRAGRAARPAPRHASPPRATASATPPRSSTLLDAHDRNIAGEDADELRATDFVTADMLAERSTRSSPARSPSGPPPTGTGPTGTSSSTRRRSCPPWTGTCWPGAAPAGRSPRSATSPSAARPRARGRWADVLAPIAGDRFTLRALTVNYRTPAEIMEAAAWRCPRTSATGCRSRCGAPANRRSHARLDELAGLVEGPGTGRR